MLCPVSKCRADNPPEVVRCERCGIPLQGYGRLVDHVSALFNRGVEAGRAGRVGEARECLAALVAWCPFDLEARNAFAVACLESGDIEEARRQWEWVCRYAPTDPLAQQGLAYLLASTGVSSPSS